MLSLRERSAGENLALSSCDSQENSGDIGSLDVAGPAYEQPLSQTTENQTPSVLLPQTPPDCGGCCSHTAVAQASAPPDISIMRYAIFERSDGNEEGCSLKMREHRERKARQVPESQA